ncbi:dihydrofolate reductase family protein [Saccharopolyspora pogona]|uniref:dihydrofolate reductase family protein n=1 Tax=Saccharopolyspora pogona TaxID=333966 RepID=UPI0016835FD5|nr:dihydrofolate reductase family protein [Saccharopolyspora pogona]
MADHDDPSLAAQAPRILPTPLEPLYEESSLVRWRLPAPLAVAYGGELGFPEPCVYGNFVSSVDGVVALDPGYPSSDSAISNADPGDRFVMGLLRTCADVVLIGAGTLRAAPGHRWVPEHVCPAGATDFAALRRSLRRTAEPELVVVTASGNVPTDHPALQDGALVATTTPGARRLETKLPPACTLVALGDGPLLAMRDVLTMVSTRGHASVLTEGGPRLLGHLVAEHLLNELFLTVSPVLAGRDDSSRPGLITGLELLPDHPARVALISARHRASYLFLRYRLNHHRPAFEDPD